MNIGKFKLNILCMALIGTTAACARKPAEIDARGGARLDAARGATLDVVGSTASGSDKAYNDTRGETVISGETEEREIQPDETLSYFNFAKAVLDRECVTCHTVSAISNADDTMRLDSYYDVNGIYGVFSKRAAVAARLQEETMPPEGGGLTAEERLKLRAWIAAGAPIGAAANDNSGGPSAKFIKPENTLEASTSELYTVETGFLNASSAATWDLYYTTLAGETSGGLSITTNLPITTTSYSWDLSAVSNGTYFLYIILRDGASTKRFASSGGVVVSDIENDD